jgi:iron(III) transport system ATP-binding protein
MSLDIKKGEFVTLLGPSGCGKSTTLRIVAGLEDSDSGTIHFGDKPIVDVSRGLNVKPDKRSLGMVFQNYAIWPHMTVFQNVAFPLKARKYPRDQVRPKVLEALELVGMGGFADRPAPLLSGGQQQRVALARAIVTDPDLLLLDEPFSNLDAKLREQLRVEMKLLQERLDIAVLFVTHDQIEALALSDRIAVMNFGVIQQQGTPRELYEEPASEFVRDFIGSTLLFDGKVQSAGASAETIVVLDGDHNCVLSGSLTSAGDTPAGSAVRVGVRPEDVRIAKAEGTRPPAVLQGRVVAALFVGERVEYQVAIPGQPTMAVYGDRRELIERDDDVWVVLRTDGHSFWVGK